MLLPPAGLVILKCSSVVATQKRGEFMDTLKSITNNIFPISGMSQRERQAFWAFLLFIAPMTIGLIVFKLIPIIWGFILSFYNAQYTIEFNEFVGIQNYIEIMHDGAFTRALITGILFVIFIVPTTYCLSLLMAVLINSVRKGKTFFRMTFFLPAAASYVLASLIWKYSLFNGMFFGLANTVLGYLNIASIQWTNSVPWVWIVLVTVRLWLQTGFYMILFLAALQNIPDQLYEAGRVDGMRNKWQEFRYITFPLLRNTSIFVIIMNIIHGFMAFDEFYNILGGTYAAAATGGNLYLARPPLVYLYVKSLSSLDYGVGSAGSFILTGILIVVTIIQGRLLGFGESISN